LFILIGYKIFKNIEISTKRNKFRRFIRRLKKLTGKK